jgi:metallo-beta-lactamase family protein
MYPPAHLPDVDYLVVESTYGNKRHPDSDPEEDLQNIIKETAERNGVILIPAFTVGRAQMLMHYLANLKKANRIPKMPIYLNSPMATNVTQLFHEFEKMHRLSDQECDEMCDVVHYVKSVEESKALNLRKGPMIILSASGMATGGRILHHLKAFAPDPHTTILLSGFQAAGTRGRSLQDGAREIKMHREMVPVRATVKVLENMSAHADYSEIIEWLDQSKVSPKKVFVTHGEVNAAQAMGQHLYERFGWVCEVPRQDQEFSLI